MHTAVVASALTQQYQLYNVGTEGPSRLMSFHNAPDDEIRDITNLHGKYQPCYLLLNF